MVKHLLCLLLLILSLPLIGDIDVKTSIYEESAAEGHPVYGQIQVIHPSKIEISTDAFYIGKNHLKVEFMHKSNQSSIVVINGKKKSSSSSSSVYRFQLPPQSKGIHILLPISIILDNKKYSSPTITYEVFSAETSEYFKISSSLESTQPIYPGQKAKIIYKILHKRNIDLLYEHLPLLKSPHFSYKGKPFYSEYFQNGFMVQEISQEIEVLKPGEYNFEPSFVEGYVYTENLFGQRSHIKPRLRAESSTLTIIVEDFPIENKPKNFNGNVGDYTLEAKLLSPQEVYIGDKLLVVVTIRGEGALSTARLNELINQKGFKDNFRLKDMPPKVSQEGKIKNFTLEIRPLQEDLKEIPPISLTYFDPTQKKYFQKKTKPIPITILKNTPTHHSKSIATVLPKKKRLAENLLQTSPIEIYPVLTITQKSLEIKAPVLLFLFLLSLIIIIIQLQIRAFIQKKKNQDLKYDSSFFWNRALGQTDSPHIFFSNLEKACIEKLNEESLLTNLHIESFKDLPENKACRPIKDFLMESEREIFGVAEKVDLDNIINKAKTFIL